MASVAVMRKTELRDIVLVVDDSPDTLSVLTDAIEHRGSSIRDYIGGSGLAGGYQDEFRAYGRTGEPCPRCGTAIVQLRLAGRSSHHCPRCQTASPTPAPSASEGAS